MTGIDWALLWDLGGDGRHVWSAYGLAATAFLAEALLLWRRLRRARAAGRAGDREAAR